MEDIMRACFSCALMGALLLAGCDTGDGGNTGGTGGAGSTSTGGAETGGAAAGGGGAESMLHTADKGDCAPSGTVTDLDNEVIYSESDGGMSWVDEVVFSKCM